MKTKLPHTIWEAVEAGLRGKFIAVDVYLLRRRRAQINNFTFHLKKPEEQAKSKTRIKKEIIKTRVEINEIDNRKTIEKIKKIQSCFSRNQHNPS